MDHQSRVPYCCKSVDKINGGYPPVLLCNYNVEMQGVFDKYAQDTYYTMKFNVDSNSRLRSVSSRDCDAAKIANGSAMAYGNPPMPCGLTPSFTNQCYKPFSNKSCGPL